MSKRRLVPARHAAALVVAAVLSLSCGKLRALLGESTTNAPSASAPAKRHGDAVAATIYDGKLGAGWQDWGWGGHDLGHGPASIDLSNYGGWILWNDHFPRDVEGLAFRMAAPPDYGEFLELRLGYQKNNDAFPAFAVGPEQLQASSEGWVQVYVPWSVLNPSLLPVDQVTLHAHTAVRKEPVKFDRLVLIAHDAKAEPPTAAESAELRVDCRDPGHPISPYIYGVGGGGDPWELGPTAHRWGGNRTTRYNFELSVTNAGKDWFFENVPEPSFQAFLAEDRRHAAVTALTLPLIGWVAKDATSSGFPVSKFGPQRANDAARPDAGNGDDQAGKALHPGPPTQTSIAADPSYVRRFIEAIHTDEQRAGARSVRLYFLDNEPNLWSVNHRDVHPDPLTYDELLERTLRYATAVREADPEALIAGPSEWGWSGYHYSAKDLEAGASARPDRRAHGDVPLVPWYLGKMREHERATGKRLLDVLDVHFYPQGANVYGAAADPETAALRVRSTRSLWDPSYRDESWIGEAIELIPRLKRWIAENDPGLKLSIGEYNFGGEQHASGALAEAEALGRFGSEGVDYAFYWTSPPHDSPAYWAFRAYRNFDGQGGHFLEQSLAARGTATVSLFASRDATSKHLVLVVLNLDPAVATRAPIQLAGCGAVASARRFVFTPQSGALVADASERRAPLDATLPPYSISVFDVHLQ